MTEKTPNDLSTVDNDSLKTDTHNNDTLTENLNGDTSHETATPAESSNSEMPKTKNKKTKDDGKSADFRVSQALYKTILTNLNVIVVLFIVGLIGWLVWYLSPLTQNNTTYNATAHETAVAIVVNSLANQANANTNQNPTAQTTTALAPSCDYAKAGNQQPFNDNINRINQSLADLYQQKRLANRYQLQTDSLWQQACEQNVSDEALRFALKTLASPDRLLQLQWLEQMPNRRNMDTTNVARLPANWLTQTNPWYGLAGCVYVPTPKTADNPTGFLYVDPRKATDEDGVDDSMNLLCNHPKLIPSTVKAQLPNATDLTQGTAMADSNVVNQAREALQNLQQKPTLDPNHQIHSTANSNTALPTNLATMYSGLGNIHSSQFDRQLLDAYQSYQQREDKRSWWQKLTAPPMNTIDIDGSDVKIGYNMALTLDPTVQNQAQQVADCVTNSPNATTDCSTLISPNLQTVANQMHENALVRSIGIAVIDVKTQGVLALASSDSNCYRVDNGDTMLNPKGCPTLWQKDWSKQNLMNHALYQAVYPGSTVKTVQALGLVRANPRFKNMGNAEAQYLKQVMASSSTEKVANFLFCQSTTSAMTLQRDGQGVCRGIPEFKKASNDMGWSVNCDATANTNNPNCGFKDLLFGKPYNSEPMIQSRYFSGVLLTDGKQDLTNKQLNFTANQVASCVQGNGGRMNGACRSGGDDINAVMNQVFGAGNARSTVLGNANSFANLLIADNGDKNRRGVHLVQDLWGVNQIPLRPKAWRGDVDGTQAVQQGDQLGSMPLNISQSDARATLNLLSGTLLAGTGLGGGNGTAYSACTQAIGNCAWTNGVVVGKTGTPGFNYPTRQNGRIVYTPNVTMSMIASQCNNADIRAGKAKPSVTCYSRPYKWFVYGIKGKDGQWDKAVAVLVERNFTKAGLVDDPRDGINRAVQAGMILAKQMYQ
ncbi:MULTISPECIES: hypothetical protein [unclassified Moraxella]|uniref:hypothetical protein n=1 Tax=unclassified Moraxella TaxID=2685852 RepID=UPI003AF910AC